MEEEIYEMSDNSLGPTGWLELKSAKTGFNKKYPIPGTTMNYKCNTGFYLADQTNPIQELTCQASRKVDFTNVNMCTREFSIQVISCTYLSNFKLWSAKRILIWTVQEAVMCGTQIIGMTRQSNTPVPMDNPLKTKTKESCMATAHFKAETRRRFFGGLTRPGNFQIALVRESVCTSWA